MHADVTAESKGIGDYKAELLKVCDHVFGLKTIRHVTLSLETE